MPKLFVSHASEDKDDFVRPLVVELKKHFEVWFDEHELKLGDSLRAKIDAGLRECDFGVVVLSPSFFAKKWTTTEMGGLFALEESNRKIILPIWHQVGEVEVRNFSPILADRIATHSSKGIDRVVDDIRTAIVASERTHDVLSPDAGKRALGYMMQCLLSQELDNRILDSAIGARLFRDSIQRIATNVWNTVQSANRPDKKRFELRHGTEHFEIHGQCNVSLHVGARNSAQNTVREARLFVVIYIKPDRFVGEVEDTRLEEESWHLTCASEDQVAYRKGPDSPVVPEVPFAAHLVERLCSHIISRAKQNGIA